MVVSGVLNGQISGQLGTSENTVEVHRSRVMEKMQAESLPDLVRTMSTSKVPLKRRRKPKHYFRFILW